MENKTYEDGLKLAHEIIENFPLFPSYLSEQPEAQKLYDSMSQYSKYFLGTEQIVILADQEQMEMVIEFKNFLETFNYQPICIFSIEQYQLLWNTPNNIKAIPERQSCYMVLVSQDKKWDKADYDIRVADFDPDSFKMILDFLD